MLPILIALLASGQATSPAPRAAPTLQQRFDAATNAADDNRCDEAIRAFSALETTRQASQNPLLAAAINVRKGRCLVRTGRLLDGEAAIRRGLPVLSSRTSQFPIDLIDAYAALGSVARLRLDYEAAAAEFKAAVDLSQGTERISPLLNLSRVTMFDHDGRALAAAQEAQSLAMADKTYTRKDLAAVQTQVARVLLNEGRKTEAYKLLKDSLAKQGGLDLKVGAADIATRSDLAIAALQNGDEDGARNYLAYTGAGRLGDSPFASAAVMNPPVCAETGLKPEDHAIIEFSLEEDRRVTGVHPIYTTGGRAAALAFSRAVADWSWRAEDAKKIPLLFRYTTRVEMRCVKAPQAPALTAPLVESVEEWAASKYPHTSSWDGLPAASALPLQRAALKAGQAAKNPAATLTAALALAQNPVTPADEQADFWVVARKEAAALDPPTSVRAFIALGQLSSSDDGPHGYREGLRTHLAKPDVAADPVSAATLRLLIAQPFGKTAAPEDSQALLDAVIDEPALPARHPLKIAAMLAQANVFAARGDLAGARAAFDRTGLTAEQCALIGLQPALKRSGASSSDYPDAAIRLGFEGWVRTEYDIGPDGRTVAPRVITAYPPFVFGEAATGIIRDTRYRSTFRPEGALACSGQQRSITFRLQ